MDEERKEPSLEDVLSELEAIILKMEERDIALDESFSLYEKGIHNLKLCNELIDNVEKKMLVLNEQGNLE